MPLDREESLILDALRWLPTDGQLKILDSDNSPIDMARDSMFSALEVKKYKAWGTLVCSFIPSSGNHGTKAWALLPAGLRFIEAMNIRMTK